MQDLRFYVSRLVTAVCSPWRLDWPALTYRASLFVAAELFGGYLFRLCFARVPDQPELRTFRSALRDYRSHWPVAVRAMGAVPSERAIFSELLLADLQRDGRLPPPQGVGAETWSIASQVGDPLSFWVGAPISFLHIEKSAGTAIATALTRLFHPLQIDTDPNRSMPPHMRSPFPTPTLAAVRDRKLVWGHYDLPSLLRLGPDRLIITFLREPRARILSLYHYWRSVSLSALDPYQNTEPKLAQTLDLAAFLRCGEPAIRNAINNLYARRLTGLYATADADPLASDLAGAAGLALRALDQFAFVGVVERMDASLDGLSSAIGARLRVERDNEEAANIAAHPHIFRPVERSPVTPEIEAELERLTQLDRVIYAACLERLEGRQARRAA